MLTKRLLSGVAAIMLMSAGAGAEARQGSVAPADPRPSVQTVQAWRDRKFGMFIHFGLFSAAGGMWNGRRIDNGYSEQILANGRLPPEEYAASAKRFDPEKFDPDAIVALAKAAGMKYIVITAKHHDGFNMFETKATEYNVVDDTPYGRDIIKELADACRRGGLAFGVYYSTIDWHHPGGNVYIEGNSNPITPAQADFNVSQLKELLGHYGPISEIWFDMGRPTPAQSARFARTVHALQPQTMVSGRVWNGQGDFTVMGDNEVPGVAVEGAWESPASIYPDTWGYRSWEARDDLPGKIREHITRLVRVVSAGGNYILNIGPTGEGEVVPFEAEVLKGVGAWLRINGEAIYATRAQPFKSLDFGYATLGEHKLYLFVAKMPPDGRLRLPGVVDTDFGTASVLGAPDHGAAPVSKDSAGAYIDTKDLGGLSGQTFMPVVAVTLDGPLHVRPTAVRPDDRSHAHLDEANGERFLRYNGFGYDAPPTVYKTHWDVDVGPGEYEALLSYRLTGRAKAVDLIVDGRRYVVALNASGRSRVIVRRDMAASPYAMRLDITPAPPRTRGDHLPIALAGVDLEPRHP